MRLLLTWVFLTLISFFIHTSNVYAIVLSIKTTQYAIDEPLKPNKISFFQAFKLKKQALKMLKENNTDKKDLTTGLVFLGLAFISFLLLAVDISNILDAIILKILFFIAGIVFLILGVIYLIRSAVSKPNTKSKVSAHSNSQFKV